MEDLFAADLRDGGLIYARARPGNWVVARHRVEQRGLFFRALSAPDCIAYLLGEKGRALVHTHTYSYSALYFAGRRGWIIQPNKRWYDIRN